MTDNEVRAIVRTSWLALRLKYGIVDDLEADELERNHYAAVENSLAASKLIAKLLGPDTHNASRKAPSLTVIEGGA